MALIASTADFSDVQLLKSHLDTYRLLLDNPSKDTVIHFPGNLSWEIFKLHMPIS